MPTQKVKQTKQKSKTRHKPTTDKNSKQTKKRTKEGMVISCSVMTQVTERVVIGLYHPWCHPQEIACARVKLKLGVLLTDVHENSDAWTTLPVNWTGAPS